MRWRYLLIDVPARITEVAQTWYRLCMTLVLLLAGPGLLVLVVTTLMPWDGFGVATLDDSERTTLQARIATARELMGARDAVERFLQ